MDVTYIWRGDFDDVEANALHAEAFDTRLYTGAAWNWNALVHEPSLGWVVARAVAARRLRRTLGSFYFDACGFGPTTAGLIALQ